MIWHIVQKELHQNIITSRFIIGTILCVVFMAAVKMTLLDEQKMLINAYNQKLTENEENLKNYQVYSGIVADALNPPERLAIFAEGVSKTLGGVITVTRQEVPHESSHYVLDNPFLEIFQSIDVVLIFKLVLSLLAMLFAFDMFSGEKESGMLKLTLATGISRARLFIGKVLGGMLSLSAALLLSFIIGMLILVLAPFVRLNLDMITRIFLIYLVSIVFIASFFTIGALISSLTHRSVTSLAISLFTWVVLVIAVPNLGDYLAAQLQKVEPARTVAARVDAVTKEFNQALREYQEKIKVMPENWIISGSYDSEGGYYKFQIATLNLMDYLDHFIPFSEKTRLAYADRIYRIRQEYLEALLEQANIVNRFTIFSPVRLYENLTRILARTDVSSYLNFLQQTQMYREQMLQYFEDKDVYHQYRFCTIMERGEAPNVEFDVFDDTSEGSKIWKATRERINWDTRLHLDLGDFPRFHYQPASLGKNLIQTLPYFTGMVLIVLILILVTYFCFVRYDPR